MTKQYPRIRALLVKTTHSEASIERFFEHAKGTDQNWRAAAVGWIKRLRRIVNPNLDSGEG